MRQRRAPDWLDQPESPMNHRATAIHKLKSEDVDVESVSFKKHLVKLC